ncbi:MAG: polyprenyl synthetase family protein, partial [Solobacterium sp.]|nr:polyprenyl synthetase family protein [Solobacterium sp.]
MRIEDALKNQLNLIEDGRVKEAMSYSLLAGGKRIRPVLLYTGVKGYGLDESVADPFACAIEMIHTYSL